MRWFRAACPCGATWTWFGLPGEGAFLKRCWERLHAKHARTAD